MWKLEATLFCNAGTRGHRLFSREGSEWLAIADNSGGTPDRTEDGVLLIRRVSVEQDGITFTLDRGRTSDSLNEGNVRALVPLLKRFRVSVDADFVGNACIEAVERDG